MVQEQSEWSWLLPSYCSRNIMFAQHCFFLSRCYCYLSANIAFVYNGLIDRFFKRSNTTIVKCNVSKHIAITPQNNKTMLRKQDGPAAIRVVRVATFRLLFPDCCRSNPRVSDCNLKIAPGISRTLEQSEGSNLEHSDCSWKFLRFAEHCFFSTVWLLFVC